MCVRPSEDQAQPWGAMARFKSMPSITSIVVTDMSPAIRSGGKSLSRSRKSGSPRTPRRVPDHLRPDFRKCAVAIVARELAGRDEIVTHINAAPPVAVHDRR